MSIFDRFRDPQPQPEHPGIVPGLGPIPTPPPVLRELRRVVAQRDTAQAEVAALREREARVGAYIAEALVAVAERRHTGCLADVLLDLRLVLVPAPAVDLRPSVPVVPGGAA